MKNNEEYAIRNCAEDSLYVTSPYICRVYDDQSKSTLIYHSLFGDALILNKDAIDFVDLFSSPVTVQSLSDVCDGDSSIFMQNLLDAHIIMRDDCDELALLNERRLLHLKNASRGSIITRIGLAVSDICNLGCSHCIHFQPELNKGKAIPIYEKPKNQLMMSWDVARTCVDLYIDLNRRSGLNRNCKIRFGNAEPLVNWPVIKKVLEYCSSIKDVSFEFSINTNLLLMDYEIAKSLKKHNVYIATSLDGATALANDSIRTRNDGEGTFQKILKKFDILADIGYPLDGFGVTVTSANFDMIDTDIIELAAERGMTEIAFDFDLVSLINVSVEDRVEKLMKIKRCADANGIYLFGMWDTPFRNLMEKTVSCSNSFCDAVGGRALEFNSDGSIKTCSHLTTTVGAISQFSDIFNDDGDYLGLIESRFPGSQKNCKGCEIEGLCGGQCHVTQEVSLRMDADDFQNLFDDMCVFYRTITKALIIDHIRANEYGIVE